ncbi:ABC transporter ATP-binding protein [Marinilabiliaceae bacterium JC017]|nr:ABC transporter ATP-binding protein [Marinilabiliaceae bacterium JC017]
MLKNIIYVFRETHTRMSKVVWGEFLHGLFLAAPTGILLGIIWEVFKTTPDTQWIWTQVAIMLGMFLLQLWIAQRVMINTHGAIYTMTTRLRIKLGNHLQKLSLGFYKKRDPGDLASVVLQDVSNVEMLLGHTIQDIFGAIFGTVFLSLFLFVMDWQLALLMLAALPMGYLFVFLAGKISNKFSQIHIASRNETGSRFIDYIMGICHLKAHNQTGKRFTILENAFNDLRKNSIKVEAVPGPFVMLSFIVFEYFFLFMVYWGIKRLGNETITIPVFVAFLVVGYRLYEPLKLLMVDYALLRYMNVSMERIIQLLKSPLQDAGKNLKPKNYDIKFDNVSFFYIDREILKNISFTLPAKGLTALVGASGSGKTTIANLVARFWDVQKGKVSIGGVDVKDMAPETVYGLISEVFQDVYLFDDTIYNNIKIGKPDATETEIMAVAQKAQVTEFLDILSDGIQTKVGEGGSHLSGGQKQRISIARAMLKDAPIVLLDEATASLDPENEVYIQQAIQELVKNKTVVVIAHKLQTIRNADKILVLENGQIKEAGKHEELLVNNGFYASFWNTQQTTKGWKRAAQPTTNGKKVSSTMVS